VGAHGEAPKDIAGIFDIVEMPVAVDNYSRDFTTQTKNLKLIRDLWETLCAEAPDGQTPRCITNVNAVRLPLNHLFQCLMLPAVPRALAVGDSYGQGTRPQGGALIGKDYAYTAMLTADRRESTLLVSRNVRSSMSLRPVIRFQISNGFSLPAM
jgi:hypothetical protein